MVGVVIMLALVVLDLAVISRRMERIASAIERLSPNPPKVK